MRISPLFFLVLVVSVPVLLLGLVLFAGSYELLAWRPPLIWTRQFGTTGYVGNLAFSNNVNSVATDGSAVYAVGDLGDAPMVSAVHFLRKYDISGNVIWDYGQRGNFSEFTGLSLGDDGAYVACVCYGGAVGNDNISILKFNPSGGQLWMRQITVGVGISLRVAISVSSSGVYIAGDSRPLTNQSFTGQVLFVRKYDSGGNIIWTSEFSNSTADLVTGVYLDSSGVYVVTVLSLVKYDLDGNMLWTISQGGGQISGDGSSIYVTSGSLITRFSIPSGFLTKHRQDGSVEWNVQFDSPDHSGVRSTFMSADSSGAYLTVNSGKGNVYMMKYDVHGSLVWSFLALFSRTSSPMSSSTITSSSDGFYIGGSVVAANSRGLALLQKYTKDGSLILFGLDPPWSFIIVGGLGAVLAASIFRYVRRRRAAALHTKPLEKPLPPHIPADIAETQVGLRVCS